MIATKVANVFSAEFHNNPYPTYAYLREKEPVASLLNPSGNPMWLISRYEDSLATLKDNRFSKQPLDKMSIENMIPLPAMFKPIIMPVLKPILSRTFGPMSQNMLDLDDPDHARLKISCIKALPHA
jgi:cytochrome P450